MDGETPYFDQPSAFERLFTKLFGVLVGLGLGLPHNHLLQVRGRKTGRLYSDGDWFRSEPWSETSPRPVGLDAAPH